MPEVKIPPLKPKYEPYKPVVYTADISPEIIAKACRRPNYAALAACWMLGLLCGIIWVSSMWNSTYENRQIYPAAARVQPVPQKLTGVASWYDYKLDGKMWSKKHTTAATRDLPKYSYALVENPENGHKTCVFINDYGPEEYTGRVIDLSSFAFSHLADKSIGLIKVEITPMSKDKCQLSTSN